jgi:predicted RNase H-like nuclease
MREMPRIAGIDGCRAGWLVVCETPLPGPWSWFVASRFESVRERLANFDAIGIDIPVGIPDRGPRECEALARQLLRPHRTSSVFSTPVRPVLGIDDYRRACDEHEAIDGRRMSRQSFFIMDKIADVDAVVRSAPAFGEKLHEVHPEISFAALGGGEPMRHAKRKQAGFDERLAHLADVFPEAVLQEALAAFPRTEVGRDDVLDAFAVLWSAKRIAMSTAERLPAEAPRDSCGIEMAIWY